MPVPGLMGFTAPVREGRHAAMSTISLVTGANRGIGREVCPVRAS